MPEPSTKLISDQIEYYRARAGEYDEWWQRGNRYDHGQDANHQWWREVAEVEHALDAAGLSGNILELACGTGWWTQRLAQMAGHLTCVDASPEVIMVNRARLDAAGLPTPTYETSDIFTWRPREKFDVVFFSFWLSHVPEPRFEAFWAGVAEALKPGGRVFLIDSARLGAPTGVGTVTSGIQRRQLNDGREFEIVKMFYEPAELAERLQPLGWQCDFTRTDTYFLYGLAQRAT